MNTYDVKIGMPSGDVKTLHVAAETIADAKAVAGRQLADVSDEFNAWILWAIRTNVEPADVVDDPPADEFLASIDEHCVRFTRRLLDAVEKRLAGAITEQQFDIEIKRCVAVSSDAVLIAQRVERFRPATLEKVGV